MKILSTAYKTRAFDNKVMKMALVPDYDSTYYYVDSNGHRASYTSTKWIITDVFDCEVEFEKAAA
jgi:hypothetical protein